MVTVLYFSIINVFWLLNLCGVGGDASFSPQANLIHHESRRHGSNLLYTPLYHALLNLATFAIGHFIAIIYGR